MPPLGRFDPAKVDLEVQNAISTTRDEAEQIETICKIRKQFRIEEGSRYYALLQGYLASDLTLTQASSQLLTPIYEEIIYLNANERKFPELWHSIFHSAKRISYRDTATHQRLIDFLHEIKTNPHPANITSAQYRESQRHGLEGIFNELYGFEYALQQVWFDTPGHGSGHTVPELHAWANLNFFVANITKAGILDFKLDCIRCMRAALEEDINKCCSRVFRPTSASLMYDALVPAAAAWVFSLGKMMYEWEVDLSPVHRKVPPMAAGGEFYTGMAGFCKDRWGMWKRRFGEIGEIGELEGLREETVSVAKEAYATMDRIEGGTDEREGKRYNLRPRKTKTGVYLA